MKTSLKKYLTVAGVFGVTGFVLAMSTAQVYSAPVPSVHVQDLGKTRVQVTLLPDGGGWVAFPGPRHIFVTGKVATSAPADALD